LPLTENLNPFQKLRPCFSAPHNDALLRLIAEYRLFFPQRATQLDK